MSTSTTLVMVMINIMIMIIIILTRGEIGDTFQMDNSNWSLSVYCRKR